MAFTQLFFLLACTLAASELNVYDKPMQTCGSMHADGCAYAAFDFGAHEVCVATLPHGFSSVTGQGPWSDQFEGQPWCICIWAYSNYILQHHDLSLKCESIPTKVLEEKYSLDKFQNCGLMSSTNGCGPEDIRRSIQSLCHQCDEQAHGDTVARAALEKKCTRILASAPAAPTELTASNHTLQQNAPAFQTGNAGSPTAWIMVGMLVCGLLAAISYPRHKLAGLLQGRVEEPLLIQIQ